MLASCAGLVEFTWRLDGQQFLTSPLGQLRDGHDHVKQRMLRLCVIGHSQLIAHRETRRWAWSRGVWASRALFNC